MTCDNVLWQEKDSMLGEYRSGGRPRGMICLKRFKYSGPPVELAKGSRMVAFGLMFPDFKTMGLMFEDLPHGTGPGKQ